MGGTWGCCRGGCGVGRPLRRCESRRRAPTSWTRSRGPPRRSPGRQGRRRVLSGTTGGKQEVGELLLPVCHTCLRNTGTRLLTLSTKALTRVPDWVHTPCRPIGERVDVYRSSCLRGSRDKTELDTQADRRRKNDHRASTMYPLALKGLGCGGHSYINTYFLTRSGLEKEQALAVLPKAIRHWSSTP